MRGVLFFCILMCQLTTARASDFEIGAGPALLFPDPHSVLITYFAKRDEIFAAQNFRLEYRRADDASYSTGKWTPVYPSPADKLGLPLASTGYTVARQRMIDDFPWHRDRYDDTVEFFHYRAMISHLDSATAYEYRITCGTRDPKSQNLVWSQCALATFQTPPGPETQTFRFASFADLRGLDTASTKRQHEVTEALEGEVADKTIDFAILPGDISNETGTPAQYYGSYFKEYRKMTGSTPFYPIQGNHDVVFPEAGRGFLRMVDLPRNRLAEQLDPDYPEQDSWTGPRRFYSFDWADARIFALDVSDEVDFLKKNQFGKGSTQYRWLEQELRASMNKRWRIVFFHIPLENSASHPSDKSDLLALLHTYKVHLIVNGHYEYPELHADEMIPRIVLPSGGASFSPRKGAENCPLESRHRFGYVTFDVTADRISIAGMNRYREKFFEATIDRDSSDQPVGRKLWIDDAGCAVRKLP